MKVRTRRIAAATTTVLALGIGGLTAGPALAADGTITVTFTGPGAAAIESEAQLCVEVYDTTDDRNHVDGNCATSPGDDTVSISAAPGDYKLQFYDLADTEHYQSEWYNDADYDSAQAVTLASGGSFTPTVELTPLMELSGSLPQNSVETQLCVAAYDADDLTLDGLVSRSCPDPEALAPANADWHLALPTGSYRIRYYQDRNSGYELAAEWDGNHATGSNSTPIVIATPTPSNLGSNTLPDAATAVGHIRGPQGAALTGWVGAETVDADGFNWYSSDESEADQNGNYTIEGLNPAGSYKVAYYGDFYEAQWYDGKASEGDADALVGLSAGTPLNLGNTTLSYDATLTPNAPRNARAIAGNASAQLTGDPPIDSEVTAPITYTATASNGRTCSTTGLNCTITGLTNDSAYAFSVTAQNIIGTSPASNTVSGTPAGTNQNGPKVVSKVKVGKTAKLPVTTASGSRITWVSKTKKTCTVKGNAVKGKKAGKCKVRATAPRTETFNAFSALYSVKVK
jgi:hypothetical protein